MRPDVKLHVSVYANPETVQVEGKLFRNPQELWDHFMKLAEAELSRRPPKTPPSGHVPHPLENLEREWEAKRKQRNAERLAALEINWDEVLEEEELF